MPSFFPKPGGLLVLTPMGRIDSSHFAVEMHYGIDSTPRDPFAARLPTLFLVVALALACVMGIANTGMNSDLFLAIAAGRQTWDGYPVGPDRWSFTVPGAIWTDQAWLSHLVLYLSYEALGNLGPVACKILLLLGCVAIVLVRCRRMGAFPGVSLLATYLGVMSSAPFLTSRAENFGVFFFLLFGLLLWEGDRDRAIRVVAIPAVMALWSNCHGSFMFGLGLLGFRVFLECCAGVWNRVSAIWSVPSGHAQYPNSDRGQWRVCIEWSLVFLGSLLLVSTLTPFGPGNVLMPFIQVGSGLVTANSADWLPLWAPGQIRGPLGAGSVFPYLISLGVLIGSCTWLVGSWLVGKDTRGTETQRREEGSPQRHRDTEKRRRLTTETQRHGEEKRAHPRDSETQRREESSPLRYGDTEKRRALTTETRRHREEKKAHHRYTETRRREERSPQRHGDTEKRRALTTETRRHREEKSPHHRDRETQRREEPSPQRQRDTEERRALTTAIVCATGLRRTRSGNRQCCLLQRLVTGGGRWSSRSRY